MRRTIEMTVLVALLALLPLPLWPCSVSPDYRVPPDYDLVKSHDVIVLARSEEFADNKFLFRVLKVLKGAYPDIHFEVEGYDRFLGRTPENDLTSVRHGALAGSCTARDYRVGHNYVLFCNRMDNGLFVHGPPFSRINEEVDGEDSPWTQAITRYSEIAAFEDPEVEHVALQDLLKKALEGSNPSSCPPAMAPGLEEYFEIPSRNMPWTVLEDMYPLTLTDAGRSRVLSAMASCDTLSDPEAVQGFVRKFVGANLGADDLVSIGTLAARVQETSIIETLLDQYTDQIEVARAIRRGANRTLLPALIGKLPLLPPRGMALLAPLFERFPSEEAKQILEERTRTLAADIGGQYDERWWDAVALAALGDAEVVDWAIADLDRGGGGGCCSLHFYILAWSPLEKADRKARAMIEDQHEVSALLAGYEDSPWPPRWDRLREAALHPGRGVGALKSLQRILKLQAEAGAQEALELLSFLREGGPPAPPEPGSPHGFWKPWISLAVAVALGLAAAFLANRFRKKRRGSNRGIPRI